MSCKKLYIIYYSWANTANNHAGMAYLAHQLKKSLKTPVILIRTPAGINNWPAFFQKRWRKLLTFFIFITCRKNNIVFLMEYLTNASGWQTEMAFEIRNRKIPVKLFGLVHLPGSNLDEIYKSDNYIRKSAEALDKIIVFGSTLEHYFEKLGFGEKTIRTFHYVDTEYYRPSVRPKSGNLQVIHMGSLKRNFSTLKNIVEACPEIEFHICQGKDDLSPDFRGFANARLYGFLLEKELLRLMQSCHVSLSIMEDSVGSNVITTSMACGLVNVVSGVGSVRDYCNEGNSFICNTKDELIDCLKNLCDDKNLIKQKSNQSVIKADCYSLYRSIAFFDDLFNKID